MIHLPLFLKVASTSVLMIETHPDISIQCIASMPPQAPNFGATEQDIAYSHLQRFQKEDYTWDPVTTRFTVLTLIMGLLSGIIQLAIW